MTKLALFLLFISCAFAQEKSAHLQFDWDKLAAKAVETTDLNLDPPMLEMAAKLARDAGLVSAADGATWLSQLRLADSAGRFFASLTGFIVAGRRPAS